MERAMDPVGNTENILLLTGEGAEKFPNTMASVIPVNQRMDKAALGLKQFLIVLLVTARF